MSPTCFGKKECPTNLSPDALGMLCMATALLTKSMTTRQLMSEANPRSPLGLMGCRICPVEACLARVPQRGILKLLERLTKSLRIE